jgi:hypothetical protein
LQGRGKERGRKEKREEIVWKSECKKNEELEEQRSRRVERKGKVKGKGNRN